MSIPPVGVYLVILEKSIFHPQIDLDLPGADLHMAGAYETFCKIVWIMINQLIKMAEGVQI